jgi:hypothetical protein
MEFETLTGIALHASVQTTFTPSHMQLASPEQDACVVYDNEQCCAQVPLAVIKQFDSFVQVLASLMLEQTWAHVCILELHAQVESPLQSVAVTRVEHTTAQLPVAVRLQSGRAVQSAPTKGHWVEHAPVLSFHSHMLDAAQLLFVAVEAQFSRQIPEIASHVQEPAELSHADLVA